MTEQQTNAYEGMFLFPQAQSADLKAAVDHITEILAKGNAEIASLKKWDERRLAYEIKGNKRGVYFLVYFNARPDAVVGIERSCNLSEMLLRTMIVKADHLTQDQIQAADGRTELADEIKLREEQAKAAPVDEAHAMTTASEEAAEEETDGTPDEAAAEAAEPVER